jgi:iron(III) transport system substrate-binding protein
VPLRAAAGLALVIAVGGVLAGCGTSGSSASGDNTIILYNGQHEQTTDALVKAFHDATGINVKVHNGDEDQLVQQIEQEGSSSPADVIYTENSPALMTLEEKGLLAQLPQSVLSQVPAQYNSPQGDWAGVSARVSVLVYNTSHLQPSQLPTSVMQLAEPEWKGKLAIAPTETDLRPVITSIALAYGNAAALSWLKGVRSNASAHIEPDNETVTADVNSGQAEIGLVDHYYWYRLSKELGQASMHSKIAYFAPKDPGYVLDVSGAGVLLKSRHQAAAEQFVAFLDSAQGQATIASSDSYEYPLRPGQDPALGLTPFADLQPCPLSIAELGDSSQAVKLEQQAELI